MPLEGERKSITSIDAVSPGTLERHEVLPYSNRTLIAFGGTSGTGLAAASEFANLGGRVIVVTSDPTLGRYEKIFPLAKRLGVAVERFSPAVADLKRESQIDGFFQDLKRNGVEPTDILLSAAGGMDNFSEEFLLALVELNAVLGSDLEFHEKERVITRKIQDIRKRLIEDWLPNSREDAEQINFHGQVRALKKFSKTPAGSNDKGVRKAIFYNSIFGNSGVGPPHYQNVLTKKMTTDWLKAHAAELANKGVHTAEIVAPVIADTKVGKVILRFMLPFFPPSLQERINDTTVTRKDVVEVTKSFWNLTPEDHQTNPKPDTIFVTRHNGALIIARELPEELSKIDVSQFPF